MQFKNNQVPDIVMVMAERNYKVFADIGLSSQYMVHNLSILDTGAGSNCTIGSLLPPYIRAQVRQGPVIDIAHFNNIL